MYRELISQLKMLKHGEVNPRAEWLASNRDILLSQIKNSAPEKNSEEKIKMGNIWSAMSIVFPQKFVFNVMRPVSIMLIVLSVVTSGWISTVDAAYEALPGDLFYPAKRVAEKTRVTVASVMGDKKSETKLHAEFAKRRAQETKKILASTDPDKNAMASQSVADLKTEMKNVNDKLEEIKNDTGTQLSADLIKDVKQNTEQIKNAMQDVKDTLIITSSTLNTQLTQEVNEAKDLAKDTAVKTVEVVVSKHLEGDNTLSKEEVNQVINNTLQTVVKDMADSKQSVEGVSKVMDAVKVEVKSLVIEDNGNKKNGENTSSTQQLVAITDKIKTMATESKEAATKAEAVVVATDKKITEVKEMLATGDLTKIMDKVKEVSEVTKEVEKTTDITLKSVQSVLPIVGIVKDDVIKASPSSTIVVIVSTTPAVAPKLPVTIIVSSTPQIVAPIVAPVKK